MNRSRLFLALCLSLVLVIGACGGGGSDDNPQSEPLDPDEVSRAVPSRLAVDVSGDVQFSFEGETDLRVVTINDPDISDLSFLSVGIEPFADLQDAGVFRIAFDLVGTFRGAGQYELPAAGEATTPSVDPENPDPDATLSGLSKVYLTYNSEGDPTENPEFAVALQSFENAVQPCDLRVENDEGQSGRLECPEVATATGETVSITMEWEAV